MSNNETNDNDESDKNAVPEFTDGAHIAGFEFTRQTEQRRRNDPAVGPDDTPLTIDAGVAGLDEPPASMREQEELDSWGGPEPNPVTSLFHETESTSSESESESEGRFSSSESQDNESKGRFRRLLSWLAPDDSDSDGEGRRGLLSTRTEIHAFVIGLVVGAYYPAAETTLDELAAVIGTIVAGDRAYKAIHIPEKYRKQITAELPYFIGGVAVGYFVIRLRPLLAEIRV